MDREELRQVFDCSGRCTGGLQRREPRVGLDDSGGGGVRGNGRWPMADDGQMDRNFGPKKPFLGAFWGGRDDLIDESKNFAYVNNRFVKEPDA